MDASRRPTLPLVPRIPAGGDVAGPAAVPADQRTGPLYQQPGIVVTDRWFVVAGYRYPIEQLSNLRTGRGSRHPLTIRATVVAVGVLVGLAAALGLAGDATDVSGASYLAIASAVIVPFVLAAVGERFHPRPYELWADYFGITVRLFYSDSEQQYGQVTRALLRAQEIARLGASAELRETEPWLSWRRMAMRS